MRSNRRNPRGSALIQLEPRTLLSGSYPYEMVLPEGFASDTIRQVVALGNTGTLPADYHLIARYERAFAEHLVAQGTLAPDTRATATVCDPANPSATTVLKNEPYALVLESTQPLVASLEHSDFGSEVSVPFTDLQATRWSFPEVRRGALTSHDFVLVYNPGASTIQITLTFFNDSAQALSVTQDVPALRRGGWAIEDIPALTDGVYGVTLSANAGFVASLSSYGLAVQKSFAVLGASGGGSVSGVLPITDLSTRTTDSTTNGSPVPPSRNAVVSILNTSASVANISLTFVADDDALAPEVRPIVVAAHARSSFNLADLSLPGDFEYAIAYSSDVAITVSISSGDNIAGGGAIVAPAAASAWDFAGGYMDAARANSGLIESLSIYNPESTALEANIDLLLEDGQVFSLSIVLDARRAASVPIHLIATFVARASEQRYTIHVSAVNPLVAAYRRWDAQSGGFITLGTPGSNAISLQGMTP